MKRIVIVGGGICGLAAAFHLQERFRDASEPLACTLIEQQDQAGGKILTEKSDGFTIEAGPDSFITQKPWALELCRKIGLSDELIPTNQVQKNIYVLSGGRLHRLPEGLVLMVPTRLGPFLRSGLISPLGKVRMAMDLLIPARRDVRDESLAAFGKRRLGREALDKIVEPLLAGIYAGDAEALSLQSTFPRFVELERKYGSLIRGMLASRRAATSTGEAPAAMFMTLRGGMGRLVEALVARLEATEIKLGRGVTAIRLGPDESGYRVVTDRGDPVQAEAVILTGPAFSSAELLEPHSEPLAQVLRQIPYISTATISVAFRRSDCPHPLNGYGYVVARNEQCRIMACTWISTKFPHRAPEDRVLIRCFAGGAGREDQVSLDDSTLIGMVREELNRTLGIKASPLFARVFRWERANPQYTLGHEERLSEIDRLLRDLPGIFVAGSAYRGVGIPDCIQQGIVAAEQAFRYLQPKLMD